MSLPSTIPQQARGAADESNARWFVEEVHSHDASLKNYVRHSFPMVRDVEDVVQESYLRVWKRQLARPITEVTGSVKASVKGFLFQVARRLALDKIRHDRVSPIDAVTDLERVSVLEEKNSVRDAVCADQEFQFILEAIDQLPARCREVVVLRKLHGLSPAETAAKLGISEETVHVQARRGLQKIQAFLRSRGILNERQP